MAANRNKREPLYCYAFQPRLSQSEKVMIIRVFRAKIRKGRVSDFKKMVKEQSIPWLEKSDGMLGYFPGAPFGENDQEFLMVSLWRDLDSLKAFAGSDWNHPVVTEEEAPLVATMIADHYLGFGKDDRLKFAGYPENN
jgi:quinol monooxygenase YgiN